MKKLFTLITMLVLGIGSMWADSYSIATTPTQVTSITSGKFYVINGIDQSTSNKHYLFDNGTKVTSNNPQTLPTNDAGKFIWKIVGNTTDGYTLQNLQTGKYMSLGSSNGSQISSSETSQTNGIYFGDGNYATIRNSNGQAIDVGWAGNNPTTWSGSTTPSGSRRLQIYEIEVICDIFADDDYNYTKWHLNYFDRNLDASEIPADVSTVAAQSGVEGDDISCKKGYLNFSSSGNHTVTFQWTGGNLRLDILGVDICDESLTVVASDYHAGFAGVNKSNNVYTVNIPSSGNYLVRYFTKMPSSSGNTNGTITWNPSVSSSDCYTYVLGGTANVSDLPEIVGKTRKSVKVIAGGLLTIDDDDFNLCSVQGAGNVVLDVNTSLTGGKSTSATGKLTISDGVILTIGEHQDQTNSIASFSSIDLAGQIKNNNSTLTLNNVTVPEGKNGVIFSKDMGGTADGFLLDGTTTVNGNLFVCNRWNFQMKVNKLAGNGTWTINGTTSDDYSAGTSSSEDATINIGSSPDFTGTIHGNNSNASVIINGTLANCTFMANHGSPKLAEGAILDGVILAGSKRISTTGNVTIRDLAGNNLSNTTNNYALVGTGTLNLEGDCDFTKKSDNSDCGCANIGCRSGSSIVIKSGANVKAAKISYDTGDNAAITIEGTLTATKLHGPVTLAEGSVTTLSEATPFNEGAVSVTGNATLNLTNATSALNQAITVASGKTLTIDGNNNAIVLTGTVTNNGIINIENATIEGGATRDFSTLPFADYDNCILIVTETTAEFNTDDEVINITKIPSYFTTIKLRRADRRYVTLEVTDGSATFTDSEAKVSGPKCLYDFTFSKETLAERKIENSTWILNSGSRGSSNGLKYDSNYDPSNSYNEETGMLKAKSTPWRDMSGDNAWPIDYSVAVYANVPNIENGCLMAFGSSEHGGKKYLALIRGTSSNEIKLVKGNGMNKAFEVIATMSAENAAVAKHLVVFTKNGSTFKVYCDGVNVATTTYDQTLGTGFQIGSVHGGVTGTGIIRINEDIVTSDVRDAVEIQSIRIFNGVLTDDQMSALMKEFPYVSKGGSYSRTISADANLGEDDAWTTGETTGETTAHIPTPVVVDASTYYPDVTITTSADATLTVNENATFGKTTFGGSGTLTIEADGSGHSINVGGAVIINSDVVVKFGAIDMSTSPVTKGAGAKLTFDFSDFNFNKVYATTTYTLTGVISQDDTHITAAGLPSSDGNREYAFAFDDNHYKLIVTVRAPQTVYLPSGTTEIEDDMAVKLTADAETNNGVLIQGDELVISETVAITCSQSLGFCSINIPEGVTMTVSNTGAQKATTITGDGTLNINMSESEVMAKLNGNASCTLVDVLSDDQIAVGALKINDAEKYTIDGYDYYISQDESTKDVVLVKHYTRNVTSGRFGSICIENAALVSQMTGIEKVLKVTSVETDRVVMDEVEEMTAGVPYIFKSNADAINLTLKGENADEPVNDPEDYLVGNFVVVDVPNSNNDNDYNYYILQSNQFKKVTSGTIKSGRNRCYLKVPVTPSSSRQAILGIDIDEDSATGIDAINSLMNNDAEIYDLNGRRLNDLRKGINIVNGVKVIVK